MSVYNGAGALGSELGALFTSALKVTDKDFSNLGMLVAICNLSSLLPLLFIGLLKPVVGDEVGGEEVKQKLSTEP